jgi:hypothetical protein
MARTELFVRWNLEVGRAGVLSGVELYFDGDFCICYSSRTSFA